MGAMKHLYRQTLLLLPISLLVRSGAELTVSEFPV
jgi:hypothetical protein